MRKIIAMLIASAMVISLVACSNTASQPAATAAATEAAKNEGPKFAWINGSIGNPVYNLYDDGAKKAAEDYGVTVDILGCLNGQSSSDKYAEQIEIAINAGYDGIVTYCSETGAAADACIKAKQAGIKVVDIVMAAGGEESYDTFMNTPFEAYGEVLAENIGKALGEAGGDIIYVQTNLQLELQNTIRECFLKELAEKYPNIHVVANDQLTTDATHQAEVLTNLFTAHPEAVGLVVCDATGGPNGARIAKEMGFKDFHVCCIDDTEDSLALVRSGDIDSTVAACGTGMLYDAIRLLYESTTEGKTLPKEVIMPLVTVTKENIDTYNADLSQQAHVKGTEWNY